MFESTESTPAHPVLPAALADALRLRVVEADAGSLVDALVAVSQIESRVAAFKASAIKALVSLRDAEQRTESAHPTILNDPIECVAREEVAAALSISCRSASNEVRSALQLCARSRTHHALANGELTTRAARAVVDATFTLDSPQLAEIERVVIDRVKGKKPAAVRQAVNRAVHALYPAQQAVQHETATKDRCVAMYPAEHGMATIEAHLPCHEANFIFANLTTAAHLLKDHDRATLKENGLPTNDLASLGNYRADALLALTRVAHVARHTPDQPNSSDPVAVLRDALVQADCGELTAYAPDTAHASDTAVTHVVIDLPTALGLADNPGELLGYGPIPAQLARELATDNSWQRWITDDTGSLINTGTLRYRPTECLREFIETRDQHCRFPGCHQPAHHCDLDHVVPYDNGGTTDPSNLGPLCRRHHRIKTHTRWDITSIEPDGTAIWTSPTGHRVHHDPSIIYRPSLISANSRFDQQSPDPIEPPPEDNPPEQPTPAWPDHLPLPTFDSDSEPPEELSEPWPDVQLPLVIDLTSDRSGQTTQPVGSEEARSEVPEQTVDFESPD